MAGGSVRTKSQSHPADLLFSGVQTSIGRPVSTSGFFRNPFCFRRYAAEPIRKKPKIMAQVEGSGTEEIL